MCSPVRIRRGILDLLSERELITAHAGTHGVHPAHRREVKAFRGDEVSRDPDLEVFVQVGEVFQHVRVLRRAQREHQDFNKEERTHALF